MSKERQLTKDIAVFVKHHLRDKHAFAPFTGQDFSAWAAFLYACQLYGRSDKVGQNAALDAMIALVRAAQQKEDVIAVFKKAIPGVLDWSYEPAVWARIAPRSLAWSPDCPIRIIACEQFGLPIAMGDDLGLGRLALVWPCPDGGYECPHTRSKPAKGMSRDAANGEHWFDCLDCKATWRPKATRMHWDGSEGKELHR